MFKFWRSSPSPVLRERNGDRALSPASFAPSCDDADRDPNQIYAPTTWAEMAHHDLVVHLSPRERTRQEILWELVASEERYVAELRSLVDLYANPLLHPLVTTPSLTPSRPSQPSASTSTASLPIASRFARTPEPGHAPASLPHLPIDVRQHGSSSTLAGPPAPASASTPNLSTRLASAFRARHPPKPPRTSSGPGTGPGTGGRLHRTLAAAGASSTDAPLPPALRDALEASVEMLRGHEQLSARLKEQWARAFPLVRGLAAIWSDQPWFLQTYTAYILALESALAALDALLPSSHAPPAAKLSPGEKRLAQTLMTLEEHAADAGESALGICLSKPLMRLGKLPLLMQALLYHTDPTTHEWEKTRAMALEVDALVRSIEDEKVEEDERERTRDALARIDGVNDKALMAPRAARILISETPAPAPAPLGNGRAHGLRGTVRRSRFSRAGAGETAATGLGLGLGLGLGRKSKDGGEWLVAFTDVVVRAVKTGETCIPGSFSRDKEKRGKHGAPRRAGRMRNTYRFLRVERWEPREMAVQKLEELNERRRAGGAPARDEDGDEDDEEEELDAESHMSFRYDADSPQPLAAPRSYLSPSSSASASASRAHARLPVRAAAAAAAAAPPSSAKFGARLRRSAGGADEPLPHPHAGRATTPLPPGRVDAPTVSSQAKRVVHPGPVPAPASVPAPAPGPVPVPVAVTVPVPRNAEESPRGGIAHARDESSFSLYEMWAAQDA